MTKRDLSSGGSDDGWTVHSAPDPKRTRPDSPEASDSDDAGWEHYGAIVDDPVSDDTDAEDADEEAEGQMRYDSGRSDDGWFRQPHPQEDIEMQEADFYDFSDRESMAYDDGDVDMDAPNSMESFAFDDDDPSDDDASDDEASANGRGIPAFPNKHIRKQYEALKNAPQDAPATKNDLAAMYKLIHTPQPEGRQSTRGPADATNATPRHRPSLTTYLQGLVRRTTRHVMKIRSAKSPITDAHVPSRDEVNCFARTKRSKDGPQIAKLRVDVGTPILASVWNEQAVRLLCKYFRNNVVLQTPVTDDVLYNMFKVHFQTLRARYVQSSAASSPALVQDSLDAKARRAEVNRLRTLRSQRVNAAEHVAESDKTLRALLPMIKSLPKEAMSGDEADHQQGNARYLVKRLIWRDSSVNPFMLTLDDLHLSTRFNPDGSASRGKFPHVRIRKIARPPLVEHAPPNLPRNFYDPAWVATLTDFERRALKMKPSVDLSFSPAVVRHAARFHHIIDGSQRPLTINDPTLPPDVTGNLRRTRSQKRK